MSNYHNEKLDKIYRKLPKLNCKGKCTDSCSLIKVAELERKRIKDFLGHDPFIQSDKFLETVMSLKPEEWKCSLLKEGKCSIYNMRPLICRLFGLVEKMACPFGCVPERWLSDEEAREYLTKAKYYEGASKKV